MTFSISSTAYAMKIHRSVTGRDLYVQPLYTITEKKRLSDRRNNYLPLRIRVNDK